MEKKREKDFVETGRHQTGKVLCFIRCFSAALCWNELCILMTINYQSLGARMILLLQMMEVILVLSRVLCILLNYTKMFQRMKGLRSTGKISHRKLTDLREYFDSLHVSEAQTNTPLRRAVHPSVSPDKLIFTNTLHRTGLVLPTF